MEAIWILALICFMVAAFCIIALAIINLASNAEEWYRQAERLRKWPLR